MDTFLLFCLGCVVMGLVILYKARPSQIEKDRIKDRIKKENMQKEMDELLHYDTSKKSKVLTLYRRSEKNNKYFSIQSESITSFQYRPENYVYTSATVGGITTGGIHKTGGYYTSQSRSSGRSSFYFYNPVTSEKISLSKIKLAPDLLKEAKNDKFIKVFIHGNYLMLEKEIKSSVSKNDVKAVHGIGVSEAYSALAMSNMSERQADRYLTTNDCKKIKNWICGINQCPVEIRS